MYRSAIGYKCAQDGLSLITGATPRTMMEETHRRFERRNAMAAKELHLLFDSGYTLTASVVCRMVRNKSWSVGLLRTASAQAKSYRLESPKRRQSSRRSQRLRNSTNKGQLGNVIAKTP